MIEDLLNDLYSDLYQKLSGVHKWSNGGGVVRSGEVEAAMTKCDEGVRSWHEETAYWSVDERLLVPIDWRGGGGVYFDFLGCACSPITS